MNRFFLSDHHLVHPNLYRMVGRDGGPLRPWARDHEEADEMMVEGHNRVVRAGDTTYFLGDVAIRAVGLRLLARMNGRKILIRGNHDIFKLKHYAEHFADVRGTHKIERVILSHYPLHPGSLPGWCAGNAHGHVHEREVLGEDGRPDPRYLNLCVERAGTEPVAYEEMVERLRDARPFPFPPAVKESLTAAGGAISCGS